MDKRHSGLCVRVCACPLGACEGRHDRWSPKKGKGKAKAGSGCSHLSVLKVASSSTRASTTSFRYPMRYVWWILARTLASVMGTTCVYRSCLC